MTDSGQPWALSHRAEHEARLIADRHYNRQKVGSPQFVPPGRCLVLRTPDAPCLWVTSWPFAEFVKHEWAGAWVNSCFRNEAPERYLSSHLIRAAVAATVARWPDVPELGMVTFIDRGKTKPKKDPGYCYIKAGFVPCGKTKGGLTAVQLLPDAMPDASPAIGAMDSLFRLVPDGSTDDG
jgi:hypothetical protein